MLAYNNRNCNMCMWLNIVQNINMWIFHLNLSYEDIFHLMQAAGQVKKCELITMFSL